MLTGKQFLGKLAEKCALFVIFIHLYMIRILSTIFCLLIFSSAIVSQDAKKLFGLSMKLVAFQWQMLPSIIQHSALSTFLIIMD